MRHRIKYLALILLLAFAMVAAGCGGDKTEADGSAAAAGEEEVQQAEETRAEEESPGLLYDASAFLADIPEWDGESPYVEVNGNKPDFAPDEIWTRTQEALDELDSLGRCGDANSCIGVDGMPDQPRGDISEIHPTGWHSDTYDFVEGGNLYNRCHLIAHKLSGDDAVDRNLITGTSYMNRQGMLPFEDQIEQYVESTHNHVMYRVTPCFAGEELVARGVHMQAISVEDNGEGLSFNVYCYNVQPGIEIDYLTGDNRAAEGAPAAGQPGGKKQDDTSQAAGDSQDNSQASGDSEGTRDDRVVTVILNTNEDRLRIHMPGTTCAKQIHKENYQEWTGTADELKKFAEEHGYVPCGQCHPELELNIDLPTRN